MTKIKDKEEAEKILASRVWQEVWKRMNDHVDNMILLCDSQNSEKAADVVRFKQLLVRLEGEFKNIISEGKAAQIKLDREDKTKPKEPVFKR